MKMKSILSVATVGLYAMLMASDTPEVSNVVMTQAAHGRKVTITYELSNAPNGAVVTFDVETNRTGAVTNNDSDWISIGGEAVCNAQGAVWRKVTSADADGNGTYTITWRPDQSWEGHKVALANGGARAVVTAWALDNTPDYMVVDISATAQPNTQRYYPAVDFLPGSELDQKGAITNNPAYKTTMLVMRKIMAKDITWTMGSTVTETQRNATTEATHQVVLTNNYYIGVFEVTQAQWGEVATNSTISANFTADRTMRPMEKVSYNEIRIVANSTSASASDVASYSWPHDPMPSSFLGLLRSKTGVDFDLPSEAQWEFAARAGHGSGYWNDGTAIQNDNPDSNLNNLCRYMNNPSSNSSSNPSASIAPEIGGTAIVGSYKPNDWGLYDMHGNVWEWCLDWYEANIATSKSPDGEFYGGRVNISLEDPTYLLSKNATGGNRVVKGGSWNYAAVSCRAAMRYDDAPHWRGTRDGFRLVCTAGLK